MSYTPKDREILRQLAAKYMEYAVLPKQKETIRLWRALNKGKMERPMVVIAQIPWLEFSQDRDLVCQVEDPFWREIEQSLRRAIYQWERFPADMVLDPYITIPKAITNTGYGISASADSLASKTGSGIYSYHYENQLVELEDVQKIQDPVITHHEAESARRMQEAAEIFQGVAPVRQSGGIQFHLGVWDTLSQLMGVENVYYDLLDRPEFLHACMERITQSAIAGIEQCNRLHLHNDIANSCHCSYIYTDEFLPDSGEGKGSDSQNCWAFGMAQLFSSVSPSAMAEFEFPYINRMAEYFGNLYYGCCERLDDRLEDAKKIPHVRKISCSPWSNREKFAENIGTELVMSNKPNPALVAGEQLDIEEIQRDLQRTYSAAKQNQVNLEYILKDISTVQHDPRRLTDWEKIAMKVAQQ